RIRARSRLAESLLVIRDVAHAGRAIEHCGEHAVAHFREQRSDVQSPLDARLKSLQVLDRKSTRLNSSHGSISYAVLCLKKKKYTAPTPPPRAHAQPHRPERHPILPS